MDKSTIVKSAIFGLAVADALGVPVEFKSRTYLKEHPVSEMIGYGTYHQPPGTWSDDTSLSLCLAESLLKGYDLVDIAQKLVAYKEKSYWTPHGVLFDIGNTTAHSLNRVSRILASGKTYELKALYSDDAMDNGNGALMRILPIFFFIHGRPILEQFDIIWEVSALTHGHVRSAIACLAYLRMAEHLFNGKDKWTAYQEMQAEILAFFKEKEIVPKEQAHFFRLIRTDISKLPEGAIDSGGYVMHSIEASFWCLLTTDTYESSVFKAINLGRDTDTTAAITGGLTGILYGFDAIPPKWIQQLARKEDLLELADQLQLKYFR